MALILASGSPRRKELMAYISPDFEVRVSNAEEKTEPGLTPEETVKQLALQKAAAVESTLTEGDVLISADTVVYVDGGILGKPHSREEAYAMLSTLSGRRHTVFTGVCITDGKKHVGFAEKTEVEFYKLSDEEIYAYIDSGEPFDKAGGYGIQGRGALLVRGIDGDFYNVMGFPVARVSRELAAFGKA